VVILPQIALKVQPLAQAALLLAAHSLCKQLGIVGPDPTEVFAATGASRSRSYELRTDVLAALSSLIRPPGRPRNEPKVYAEEIARHAAAITSATLTFLLRHPGSAQIREQRGVYDDTFRLFATELCAKHRHIPLDACAKAMQVPLGTLKVWMAAARSEPQSSSESQEESPTHDSSRAGPRDAPSEPLGEVAVTQIETVITEWRAWRGSFAAFCEYIRDRIRIPMGRQFISRILEACELRTPRRRQGRSPDEVAMRGAFETFFAGAQWVGDGKSVQVFVNGNSYTCNLELQVDAHTSSWVGLSVREQEDSAAVVESFDHGIATTGAAPIAELLDNKPSNHSPQVDEALEPQGTIRIRSTTGRPENKAHVEGAFGLFSQHAPTIELDTNTDEPSIARALVLLVATTFAQAINQRPRADRAGHSRIELYAEEPSEEQIADARRALKQRWHKQEQARATREARQLPQVRELLDREFEALGLLDPQRHIRIAIGAYPLDAIVDGIAIFKAKRDAGTLPVDVDARYLRGIVRNVTARRECERIAVRLLQQRLDARDEALRMLTVERDGLCQPDRTASAVVRDCIAAAIETDRRLDRLFWLTAAVDQIRKQDPASHPQLYGEAVRRIGTAFRVPPRQRQNAIRFLADHLVPIHDDSGDSERNVQQP